MAETKSKAPEPIRHPTPKQRLHANTRLIKDYVVMVDSEVFQQATDLAMLQYQQQTTQRVNDTVTGAMAGLKLQGAQEFLAILRSLPDTSVVSTRKDNDNLQEKS